MSRGPEPTNTMITPLSNLISCDRGARPEATRRLSNLTYLGRRHQDVVFVKLPPPAAGVPPIHAHLAAQCAHAQVRVLPQHRRLLQTRQEIRREQSALMLDCGFGICIQRPAPQQWMPVSPHSASTRMSVCSCSTSTCCTRTQGSFNCVQCNRLLGPHVPQLRGSLCCV